MTHIVLVGGGHSHVAVLRGHMMQPIPDVQLTVVVDEPVAVYSGMVPGFVAGQYRLDELEIDVRPLARRAGARFVQGRVTRIDADAKCIEIEGRPAMAYDLCSVNVGSTVIGTDTPGVREFAFPTRPIGTMCRRLDAAFSSPPRAPGDAPYPIVVVGAGAGGVELAFCLRERLRADGHTGVHVTLVSASELPLPGRRAALGERIVQAATQRGIDCIGGQRVVQVRPDAAVLADGRELPSALTVWVAGATGQPLFRDSGLPTDERGFAWVADTLEVEAADGLFAVGDCAVLRSWPQIPKAGVYAVRQGPVLLSNLRLRTAGRPLQAYKPQSDFFTILNLGDGTAVGSKWTMAAEGAWMFQWKDRIDRQFMNKFQLLQPSGARNALYEKTVPRMAEMQMVCGGCAAKLGHTPLTSALERLPPAPPDPSVTLGLHAAEDVVAFRHAGAELVQNIDAFTAFTDDPWLVGLCAAVNATSDLHAKGATPRWAMSMVTLPQDHADPEGTLFQVLSGARHYLDREGISLMGGHTTVGSQLTVGFTVTGLAERPLWRQSGLKPGDALVLTRGLGTGVLWHADAAGLARGPWMSALAMAMTRGNGAASRVLHELEPSAVTDVTGFGLAGHLSLMCKASGVSATIDVGALPAMAGALELLERGQRSTFHPSNREVLRSIRVTADPGPRVELLFDPQTCGGLLVGIAADRAEQLVEALRAAGDAEASVIGHVCAQSDAFFEAIGASGV